MVLFTDLANPTTNALYPRIGYRPVSDRVEPHFEPDPEAHPDATHRSPRTGS